jgi:prepilin-type processing-associated H-X9-DG protein
MSYIGQTLPADSFQGFTTDTFTGDGSATTFTLSKAPFSEDSLIVVVDNVIQQPTTNFTVSGTTLTIVGTAILSGITGYAIHTGGALPIGQAASLDLNGASDQLILDADADTTISADTDDQIDFKLGGVDEMTMSSSGIVINEGSNDRDFRVESNGKANMLFVDGGNDRVNMGASTGVAATVVIADSDSGQNTVDANGNTFVIEKNDNCGMTILSATNGGGYIHFGDSDDADIAVFEYNHDDNSMRFTVNTSEAMRINSSGRLLIGHTSPDLASVVSVRVSTDDALITADNSKSDVSGYMIRSAADRGATLYYSFYDALSGNAADREFYVRGDGNVYADGSVSGSGADYAEFFESKTGNAIAVGTTVVLEDNKVRASTDSDEASSIIGVVRPKSNTMIKASMVIGNCAWNHWSGKYLTDDYDSFITEEFTITEWTETTYEDGNPKTEEVWYETDKIPSDVTVPTEDVKDSDGRVIKTKAVVKTTEADGVNKLIRKKENSSFDKSKEYSPRENRDEWIIVGLLGQVPINKGQKTGDRWIKMRDKSDTVEEWYIR